MKYILLFALLAGLASGIKGQNAYPARFRSEQTQQISLYSGWEYGMVAGLAYGRSIGSKRRSFAHIDASIPWGAQVFDDFKIKTGLQTQAGAWGGFALQARLDAIFRQYRSEYATLTNLGAAPGIALGYYRPRAHIAVEGVFDMALATRIRHTESLETLTPGVRSGRYGYTGGNFVYGIAAGWSFRRVGLDIKLGKISAQGGDTAPLIPFYAQIGAQVRW